MGVLAAEGAVGITFDFDLAEGAAEGAVVNEAAQWWGADFGEELDRFHGLEAADDSWEHAEDTCVTSGGNGSFRGRLRKEAAVAGAAEVGGEDGDLSLELENGSMDEGFFEKEGGVVCCEAGGEIIGAVEEGIVILEEVEGVFGSEASGVEGDFDVWIDLLETGFGAVQLWGVDAVGIVEDLAMEVREFDLIGVDEADLSEASGGEV